MTAPALPNAPQIGSTGLVQQPGVAEALAPLLHVLQQRQRIDLAKQELAQRQQDFELQKKLMGPQIEGMELANLKKKQELKTAEDEVRAADQAHQLVAGNLMRLTDPVAFGEVISHVTDPLVAKHIIAFRDELLTQQQHQTSGALAGAQATHLTAADTQDAAVRQVLAGYAGKLNTPAQQAKAIADVAAIDPQAAQGLATTFNQGAGRYNHVVGPDGFLYILDTKLGTARKDTAVGQKVALNQDAIRRGAQTVVDLFDEATTLLKKKADADVDPVIASTVEHSRVLGVPLGAAANIGRTDEQQQFRLLRTRFAHNYVGLLPHSRSAANLLQNLTESYFAPPGSSAATRQRAQKDRLHLRAVLDALARGQSTDLSKLPGFAEAAQAAAAEGTAPTGGAVDPMTAPNPADWSQGVPP